MPSKENNHRPVRTGLILSVLLLLPLTTMAREDAAAVADPLAAETLDTEQAEKAPDPQPGKAQDPRETEIKDLQFIRDKLSAENAIRTEKLNRDLAGLREQKERLAAAQALEKEKLAEELTAARTALERLQVNIDSLTKQDLLAKTEREAALNLKLAELRDREAVLKAEDALRTAESQAKIAELRSRKEQLEVENAVLTAQASKTMNELKIKEAELKSERLTLDFELAKLDFDVNKRNKIEAVEDGVDRDRIAYLENPLEGDSLIVSDRRITLNGPIYYDMADYVTERINFYNNKSKVYPIFIVIDQSPGGSVMAGYRILKAMEGSQAPVYVVVKSFAASMAASITTLADKSFAYPNAIILHHQISGVNWGNLTQQKEQMEKMMEWWERLAKPIAGKMGISIEAFIKQMYAANSEGDWDEFADKAQQLKWVDHVINEVRETSRLKNPDRQPMVPAAGIMVFEEKDEKGKPFMRLPRLEPFDFYYLYNPDNYYRL